MKTLDVQATSTAMIDVRSEASSKSAVENAILEAKNLSKNAARRKFMAEANLQPKPAVGAAPATRASDATIEQDLADVEAGKPGAFDKLIADIGGIANLSSFRFTDPNLNPQGSSLLGYAAYHDLPDVAKQLLSAGFDVNTLEGDEYHTLSIIMAVANNPGPDSKIWEMIALSMINDPKMKMDTLNPTITVDSSGKRVDPLNPPPGSQIYGINGDSPLQEAIAFANTFGDFKMLDALIAKGINVNIGISAPMGKDPKDGSTIFGVATTPLFMAILAGNTVLVEHLLTQLGAAASGGYYPVIIGIGPNASVYSDAIAYLNANMDTIIKEDRGSTHNYDQILAALKKAEQQ